MPHFVGFDIESTGVDPDNDRILTFSIVTSYAQDTPMEWFINPGVTISDGATAVHGIDAEACQDWESPVDALNDILNTLKLLDTAVDFIFTAYNCPFDLTMLRAEMKRHGVISEESTVLEDMVNRHGILDPLVLDKALDRFRRGSRKLIDTAEHFGFDLKNAHNATADVLAALHLADVFYNKFRDDTTVEQIMQMQVEAKKEQALSLSDYFKRQGREDWEVSGAWPFKS